MSDDAPSTPLKRTSVDTRFKKGASGNPKGRPKGSKNRSTILDQELDALIVITEDGVKKKVSKWEAAVKQHVNQAVKGDRHAFKNISDLQRQRINKSSDDPQAEASVSITLVGVDMPSKTE